LPVDINLIEYENTPIKLVALRKIPKIETPGLTIEEVEERNEVFVPFWISGILVDSGLAKYSEEGLTSEEWTATHFKERFNPGGAPGALPKDFYAKAYISLRLAAKAAEGDAVKTEQINRLHARFREIIDSRVNKVARMATTEAVLQPGILQLDWRREIRRLSTR
jgi:hypothetical protein